MRLAERLRMLDEQMVWVDAPEPSLTPGLALALGLVAIGVYVGWALVWSWPLALIGVCALVAGLSAIARFWFAPPTPPAPARQPLPPPAPIMQQLPLDSAAKGTSRMIAAQMGGDVRSDAEGRAGVARGGVGQDVDEVRRSRVEAST